jgi:hypothetical protein
MQQRCANMKRWAFTGIALAACIGAATAAARPDGAVIRNSGSTNFAGYTIKVHSDGSTWAVRSGRGNEQIGTPVTTTLPKQAIQKLLDDAKAAKLSGHVIAEHCMKSASFGSTMVVEYHGWTSPDLECPGGGFVIALAADAKKIAALLPITSNSSRRGLLPNEPRRPESPAVQASPTPESAPTTP